MYIDLNRFRTAMMRASALRNSSALRARLDGLHAQIRATRDRTRLSDLVDEYVVVAATIASSQASGGASVMSGFVPGGAIVSAAINSMGTLSGASGAAAGAYG